MGGRWQPRENVRRGASSTCSIGMPNPGKSYSLTKLIYLVIALSMLQLPGYFCYTPFLLLKKSVFLIAFLGYSFTYLFAACSDAEGSSQGKESVDNLAISQYLLVSYVSLSPPLSLSCT